MPLSNLFISHCRTPTSPLLCPQDNGNTRSLSSPFSSMTGFLPDTQNFARSRFYRFFQFVRLDSTLAAHVMVELLGLGGKPWVLAIDRTNWDFGKTTIDILMISVTLNGMGIPLLWMLLPTVGNSHTSERTELLDRLRAAFPDLKIAALMGDREFMSGN